MAKNPVKFEHKGNMLKCQRCSEKAGHDVYFFSRVYAEKKQKPLACPRCKRYDFWKKREKVGQRG